MKHQKEKTRGQLIQENSHLKKENRQLRNTNDWLQYLLKPFDPKHAYAINEIHLTELEPSRCSLTIDGLHIDHLLTEPPKIVYNPQNGMHELHITLKAKHIVIEDGEDTEQWQN